MLSSSVRLEEAVLWCLVCLSVRERLWGVISKGAYVRVGVVGGFSVKLFGHGHD